jgi:outer membrane protein assembly factor BamB
VRPTSRFAEIVVAALFTSRALSLAPQQPSLDYTQWRGNSRDGSASGFVPPATWPETLTRKWKTEVGDGYATPLVSGGVVYAFTRRDGREVLTALNAESGQPLWESGYPAPYTPGAPAAAHGAGPKATPLLHDGRVFTLGISGIVTAFDGASGKRLWQTAAPAEAPFFGAASSPVGEKDLVIVHPGDYGALTAFDAATGSVRWRAGEDGFFMSPLVCDLDGVRQAVTVTQSAVIGVSVTDGRVLWHAPWSRGGSGGTMPVLYDGMVIVSALDSGVAAFRPVKAAETWTVETVWTTKDVSMYVSNPVVIGDTLFGLSHRSSGQYFALDATTGKTLWLGSPRQAANTAVVKAGDVLFLLNDDGELIMTKSSRTGFEPLRRYQVSTTSTWAQPAISGHRFFIKDATSVALWSLDAAAEDRRP